MIVFSFISNSWLSSQELEPDRKALEEKLQELYSQIYDLKQQSKTEPHPELKEEIKRLEEEAKKIEEKIREKIERGDAFPDKQNIEKQIQQKKKQLKELQKQMEQCEDEEEKEYLELYRQKLLEDLGRFQEGPKQRFQKEEFIVKMPKEKKLHDKLQEFLKFLEQENREEFQKLMKLKERDFHLFRKHLQNRLQDFQKHRNSKKENPEIAPILEEIKQLENKIQNILRELENIPQEEQQKKIEEIKSLLSQIFDLKIRIQEKEVAEIEKQWQKSKAQLEKHQKNKGLIIEKRLKELLGQEDEWDW